MFEEAEEAEAGPTGVAIEEEKEGSKIFDMKLNNGGKK